MKRFFREELTVPSAVSALDPTGTGAPMSVVAVIVADQDPVIGPVFALRDRLDDHALKQAWQIEQPVHAHRPLGRRVRPGPRRRHPHQGARLRAHQPQAPRRPPRRARRAARRRLGARAPDALPALAAIHRDAFIADNPIDTTVRLDDHRGDSDLEDLTLDDTTD